MKTKTYRFLFRFPRIAAIVFILFISMFALDVFNMGLNFRQTMGVLSMHLIPSFLLTIILILSRKKYPLVGAIVFMIFGLRYTILNLINFFRVTEFSSMPAYYYFVWIAAIALPVLLVGFCFFRDWKLKRKNNFIFFQEIMKKTSTKNRYEKLKKPSWAPPGWLFGVVWSVLYILIIISFGKVFLMGRGKEIPFIVILPFISNLVFNIIFSPIQFRFQNNLLASIDIVLIRGTIVRSMIVIFPYQSRIAYMQIPYLLRVSLATVLQFNITYMNRK